MQDLWKFIKTSGIYFIGTVMTKLITFLLLPLYTSYIKPAGMGIYDVATAYVTFLCSIVYLDIWSSVMRFTYEYNADEQKKPVTNGVAIFVCSSAIYTCVMLLVEVVFDVDYMIWIYLYGLLVNTQTFCGYVARTQGKNALYTMGGIISSLVTIGANIVLLVGLKMEYNALFIASCIGYVVNIFIIVSGTKMHKLLSIKALEWRLFREMLMFSLPLCVNSVAYWFLSSYNRVAITNELGSAANGMYAIAGRFGSFITLFTSCFTMAWQEISYSNEAQGLENQGEYYTKAINAYVRFLGMGLLMSIPVVQIIYPVMVNESYGAGKEMVPLYLLATVTSAISSFLGNIFTATKKNHLLFYTTVIGSIVNVVTVHCLMPIMGVQGASIALFLGFGINCVIRILMLKKHLQIRIGIKFIILLFMLFVGVWQCYNYENIFISILSLVVLAFLTLFVFRETLLKILESIKVKYGKK